MLMQLQALAHYEDLFLFRIDYIMHSKNLKAHKTTVDRVKYSDHYPVLTYLHRTIDLHFLFE